MAFCTSCGFKMEDDAQFCTACGRAVGSANAEPPPQEVQPPPQEFQPPPQEFQPPPQGYQPPPQGYQPPPQGYQPPPQGYQPPPQGYQPPPQGYQPQQYQQPLLEPEAPPICGIFEIFGRVSNVLRKKPVMLWGISLMFTLLTVVALFITFIPFIYLPIIATLEFGMVSVYLAGYRGKEIGSGMLFGGFNDFKRVAGGMLWMWFWLLIWFIIPLAGIVFVVIKGFAYMFVPYILLTQPDISATQALKRSVEMTQGYKGKMFGAYILIFAIVVVAFIILYLLGLIPYLGIVFKVIYYIFSIACIAFLPLFEGLVGAAFYDEIERVRK